MSLDGDDMLQYETSRLYSAVIYDAKDNIAAIFLSSM